MKLDTEINNYFQNTSSYTYYDYDGPEGYFKFKINDMMTC